MHSKSQFCSFCGGLNGDPWGWLHTRRGSWKICECCSSSSSQALDLGGLEFCVKRLAVEDEQPADLNPFIEQKVLNQAKGR